MASAFSYGLYSVISESAPQDKTSLLTDMPEILDKLSEETQTDPSEPTTTTSPTPERLTTSSENMTVSTDDSQEKTYSVDENWFKTVGKHSMAHKYKDYLILSDAKDKVWEEKAQVLKEMAEKDKNKRLNSYWYGYWKAQDINAEKAHQFCTWALSYSEWTTFWSIGVSKKYFDLLWKTCGRDGMSKPSGWWFR